MLRIQPITKELNNFDIVKDLYLSAFPKQERVPPRILMGHTKRDVVKFNAYYDEDVFVGLSYTVTFEDLTYLFFLATRADIRSKGYGSQILDCIKAQHPNSRIVLNLEAQDETADNSEQRKKRREFYFRNGYAPTGMTLEIHGNLLELLFLDEKGTCTKNEYQTLFKKFWGPLLFHIVGPKRFVRTS